LEGLFDAETVREIVSRGWELIQNGYNYTDPDAGKLNAFVNTPMVGASGAIYGILLAFGFLFPNVPIYIFFIPVPIKAKWLVMGYFVIELFYGVGGHADGIAHFAHIGGMVFGFLLLLYWKRKGVFNNRWFF
ncbi:MAG: rhomboid family intramembrane serine protease, partial [Muribaculaceae bacterium]|nr:rhomboid family intramembrane serine protease [Muribaculaceae bacterium]